MMTVDLGADICSSFYCVDVLIFGFSCPLWFLGGCVYCRLPGRKYF